MSKTPAGINPIDHWCYSKLQLYICGIPTSIGHPTSIDYIVVSKMLSIAIHIKYAFVCESGVAIAIEAVSKIRQCCRSDLLTDKKI